MFLMNKLDPYGDFLLIHRITPYTSVEKSTQYFNVDCLSWPDNGIYWQYSEYSKDIDNSIEFNLWTRLCSTAEQFRAIPPKLLLAKTVHSGLLNRTENPGNRKSWRLGLTARNLDSVRDVWRFFEKIRLEASFFRNSCQLGAPGVHFCETVVKFEGLQS